MTFYKDNGNRSVSDEQIALAWIKAHPEAAMRALGRSPPPARRMAITTKSKDGKTVDIERADPEQAA